MEVLRATLELSEKSPLVENFSMAELIDELDQEAQDEVESGEVVGASDTVLANPKG